MITVETRTSIDVEKKRIYPPPEPQFPKLCRNCGTKHTAESWAALPVLRPFEDAVVRMELRNCTCKSTLAVITAVLDPVAYQEEEE